MVEFILPVASSYNFRDFPTFDLFYTGVLLIEEAPPYSPDVI